MYLNLSRQIFVWINFRKLQFLLGFSSASKDCTLSCFHSLSKKKLYKTLEMYLYLMYLTIDIIIQCIDEFKEIDTRITKNEMRELILLCTKNVHFTFNGEMFTQVDNIAMGSPLVPNISWHLMMEL